VPRVHVVLFRITITVAMTEIETGQREANYLGGSMILMPGERVSR
jgi:hypothetical protein